MVDMAAVVAFLYPTAVFLRDVTVQDNSDGKGAFIAQWDDATLGPQPSLKDLAVVEGSPEYQTYLATREKTAAIEQGKAGITPKDIAIARLAYTAAGKAVPEDADLVVQIQAALEAQK